MATSQVPNSYVLSANTQNSWPSILNALKDNIQNASSPSSQWSVDDSVDDTGSSGDYGLTISPDDTNENFQVNLRHDDDDTDEDGNTGTLEVMIDPGESITTPLDPSSSASGDASNEAFDAGDNLGTTLDFHSDFLVAEWADAITLLFKDPNNDYTTWGVVIGRNVVTHFSNDEGRGLDGLSIFAGKPKWLKTSGTSKDWMSNSSGRAEVRLPGRWSDPGEVRPSSDSEYNNQENVTWPSGDETPAVVTFVWNDGSSEKKFGYSKYFYLWHTADGGGSLTIFGTGNSDGFLYLSHDGGNYYSIIGWNQNVNPV